jgi:hypothetical protein
MKLVSGTDILKLGEAMASLRRMGEMCDPEKLNAAVRAGCTAADINLQCRYPDCKCKGFPKGVQATIIAWEHYEPKPSK